METQQHEGVKMSKNGRAHLTEIWERLAGIGQKLWEENSPSAVGFQALSEEFKGEVARAEQMFDSFSRNLVLEREAVGAQFKDKIGSLEKRIQDLMGRTASLESMVLEKDKYIQDLLKELAEKEFQNQEFHNQYLKSAAEKDETQAKKMEEFYRAMRVKEESLEAAWISRQRALDEEYKEKFMVLEKRQAGVDDEIKRRSTHSEVEYTKRQKELDEIHDGLMSEMQEWESRRFKEEQGLHERRAQLDIRDHELSAEYHKKQLELQSIKEELQRQIVDLVKQYQSKLKQGIDQ
jgi:hypothetical protein